MAWTISTTYMTGLRSNVLFQKAGWSLGLAQLIEAILKREYALRSRIHQSQIPKGKSYFQRHAKAKPPILYNFTGYAVDPRIEIIARRNQNRRQSPDPHRPLIAVPAMSQTAGFQPI